MQFGVACGFAAFSIMAFEFALVSKVRSVIRRVRAGRAAAIPPADGNRCSGADCGPRRSDVPQRLSAGLAQSVFGGQYLGDALGSVRGAGDSGSDGGVAGPKAAANFVRCLAIESRLPGGSRRASGAGASADVRLIFRGQADAAAAGRVLHRAGGSARVVRSDQALAHVVEAVGIGGEPAGARQQPDAGAEAGGARRIRFRTGPVCLAFHAAHTFSPGLASHLDVVVRA